MKKYLIYSVMGILCNVLMLCWNMQAIARTSSPTSTPMDMEETIGQNIKVGMNATQVSAGSSHACALLKTGRVKCWGLNASNQSGNDLYSSMDSISTPVWVVGVSNITAIDADVSTTCGLQGDGSVTCWGGENSLDTDDIDPSEISNAIRISLDTETSTIHAVNNDGTITPSSSNSYSNSYNVSDINNAVQMSCGSDNDNNCCAVLDDGTVACWGGNTYGQLGNGTTTDSSIPVFVTGITDAVAVSTANSTSCAVLSNGEIKCWGVNTYSRLGNNSTIIKSLVPVSVSGIANAVSVSVGYLHVCAVMGDNNGANTGGYVRCWGSNRLGQLGNGTTTDSSISVLVTGINNAVGVSVGISDFSCAVLSNGDVKCWGLNSSGQLGNGTTTDSSIPVKVNFGTLPNSP